MPAAWGFAPPRVLTPRLVLRRWEPADAERLKAAIDFSLADLKPWIPWAAHEPSSLETVRERVTKHHDGFGRGPEWPWGIFDPDQDELFGGIGLHARVGPDALEIGYWVRSDVAGRGYATEATAATTSVAVAMGARHVEIHCDPANGASARVAAKLGYRHDRTIKGNFRLPGGQPRDTMLWVWPATATPYVAPAEQPA